MKRSTKALLTALSALLLVVTSVFGTIAYLTDDDAVTNTFTVGNVDINLDEADVSTADENDRTEVGNEYHLIPGSTYTKDPTVTVIKGSEEAYIRMKVQVVGMENLQKVFTDASYYGVDNVFLLQKLCNWDSENWTYAGYDADTATYEFRYKTIVDASDATKDVVLKALFTEITVPGDDVTSDNIDLLENVKIVVTAEAIQAAGFDTAGEAWTAFGK